MPKAYIVEKILDHAIQLNPPHYLYLVKWKGYGLKDSTWEPPSSFSQGNSVLSAYITKHALKHGYSRRIPHSLLVTLVEEFTRTRPKSQPPSSTPVHTKASTPPRKRPKSSASQTTLSSRTAATTSYLSPSPVRKVRERTGTLPTESLSHDSALHSVSAVFPHGILTRECTRVQNTISVADSSLLADAASPHMLPLTGIPALLPPETPPHTCTSPLTRSAAEQHSPAHARSLLRLLPPSPIAPPSGSLFSASVASTSTTSSSRTTTSSSAFDTSPLQQAQWSTRQPFPLHIHATRSSLCVDTPPPRPSRPCTRALSRPRSPGPSPVLSSSPSLSQAPLPAPSPPPPPLLPAVDAPRPVPLPGSAAVSTAPTCHERSLPHTIAPAIKAMPATVMPGLAVGDSRLTPPRGRGASLSRSATALRASDAMPLEGVHVTTPPLVETKRQMDTDPCSEALTDESSDDTRQPRVQPRSRWPTYSRTQRQLCISPRDDDHMRNRAREMKVLVPTLTAIICTDAATGVDAEAGNTTNGGVLGDSITGAAASPTNAVIPAGTVDYAPAPDASAQAPVAPMEAPAAGANARNARANEPATGDVAVDVDGLGIGFIATVSDTSARDAAIISNVSSATPAAAGPNADTASVCTDTIATASDSQHEVATEGPISVSEQPTPASEMPRRMSERPKRAKRTYTVDSLWTHLRLYTTPTQTQESATVSHSSVAAAAALSTDTTVAVATPIDITTASASSAATSTSTSTSTIASTSTANTSAASATTAMSPADNSTPSPPTSTSGSCTPTPAPLIVLPSLPASLHIQPAASSLSLALHPPPAASLARNPPSAATNAGTTTSTTASTASVAGTSTSPPTITSNPSADIPHQHWLERSHNALFAQQLFPTPHLDDNKKSDINLSLEPWRVNEDHGQSKLELSRRRNVTTLVGSLVADGTVSTRDGGNVVDSGRDLSPLLFGNQYTHSPRTHHATASHRTGAHSHGHGHGSRPGPRHRVRAQAHPTAAAANENDARARALLPWASRSTSTSTSASTSTPASVSLSHSSACTPASVDATDSTTRVSAVGTGPSTCAVTGVGPGANIGVEATAPKKRPGRQRKKSRLADEENEPIVATVSAPPRRSGLPPVDATAPATMRLGMPAVSSTPLPSPAATSTSVSASAPPTMTDATPTFLSAPASAPASMPATGKPTSTKSAGTLAASTDTPLPVSTRVPVALHPSIPTAPNTASATATSAAATSAAPTDTPTSSSAPSLACSSASTSTAILMLPTNVVNAMPPFVDQHQHPGLCILLLTLDNVQKQLSVARQGEKQQRHLLSYVVEQQNHLLSLPTGISPHSLLLEQLRWQRDALDMILNDHQQEIKRLEQRYAQVQMCCVQYATAMGLHPAAVLPSFTLPAAAHIDARVLSPAFQALATHTATHNAVQSPAHASALAASHSSIPLPASPPGPCLHVSTAHHTPTQTTAQTTTHSATPHAQHRAPHTATHTVIHTVHDTFTPTSTSPSHSGLASASVSPHIYTSP